MTRQDDSGSHIMDPPQISHGQNQVDATKFCVLLETQGLVVAAQSGSQAAFSDCSAATPKERIGRSL